MDELMGFGMIWDNFGMEQDMDFTMGLKHDFNGKTMMSSMMFTMMFTIRC